MSVKHSESIIELSKSLVKFNAKVGKVSKDANNPFFKNKYATIDNIIEEIRPILAEFGLSILQLPSGDGASVQISTLLIHESGEWLESETLTMKPVKNDPQGMGSAITYARRYSLQSFLSLNTGEDDDGNNASQQKKSTTNNAGSIGTLENKVNELSKLRKVDPTVIYKQLRISSISAADPKDLAKINKAIETWLTNAKKEAAAGDKTQ